MIAHSIMSSRSPVALARRLHLAGLPGLLWLALAFAGPARAETGLAAIRVPPGFTVELAAGPPLLRYPMLGGFDEQGRLYVCESAGGNDDEAGLLRKLPNFIRRIEDTDGDGRFDRGTVFADRMTFPEGALWHEGALYTTSPPYLWRLRDTDGDGIADQRDPIVGKFRSYGHAGDIHGPFLAPDGRLAFTDAPLGHEIRDATGRLVHKGTAARVFLCDGDGGHLESFCGGGTYNPIEVAFTPAGEMIGIMTWYNPDEARHDALVHFVLNGVYPRRVDAWINEFKQTGPLMPAITRYGTVAPSGIVRYRSDAFGPAFKDSFFVSYYNTHRVNRIVLARDGATFRADETPFFESSDPDFRACDVLEDADGSLLVIDTGGWFINGCPSAKIAKPEKLGAIYRVRKSDAPRPRDPRGLALDWKTPSPAELAGRLSDPRPAVADRAVAMLGRPNDPNRVALAALLAGPASETARLQAIWGLARHRTDAARERIRSGLSDASLDVRLAAARCAGMDRDGAATPQLLRWLDGGTPAERREAASALSRLARPEAVPALLGALVGASDRFLEHALIDALIGINAADSTAKGLVHPSAAVRRGALIALDQMAPDALPERAAGSLLEDPDPTVRQTAVSVIGKRPAWTQQAIGRVRAWLAAADLPAPELESLRRLLGAFWKQEAVRGLAQAALARPDLPTPLRRLILDVWAQAGPAPGLPNWRAELQSAVMSPDESLVRPALSLMRASPTNGWGDALARVALDPARTAGLRLGAAEGLADAAVPMPDAVHDFVVQQARPTSQSNPVVRLAAARILGRAAGTPAQWDARTAVASTASPIELPALLRAFEKASGEPLGLRLVAALRQSPGLDALSPDDLEKVVRPFDPRVRDAAAPLLQSLQTRAGAQAERLKSLGSTLSGGNPAAGREVFFGSKAGCAVCHRIAGFGGTLGPDLSSIGEVRTRRDLLEAIVYPSASFARGFEPIQVVRKNGEVEAGLLHQETEASVELTRADQTILGIPRGDIASMGIGSVSLMPQGLDGVIAPEELRSLLAFLAGLKGQSP
ncbi:MAG: hypothetical protein DVB31_15870 [Verrucomicrobia bacterium]|nr:MAG: hypothetical protein DVB31_15870 [Verrucomicrobiota bacterium]